MINFAEFYNVIPKTEFLELYVVEDGIDFNIEYFTLDFADLKYPWYQYEVISIYSYYDKDIKDSILHAMITHRGEDKNYVEEE